jgi:hypothetical protein
LTSLPTTIAGALAIAELYRNRWSVETLFQIVTENFEGEIQTLGYPPAALFSFCMALVAYNLLATVKAALRAVHGAGKVEAGLSWYYLVEDVQATYRGLSIAIEPDYWQQWRDFATPQLAQHLGTAHPTLRCWAFCKNFTAVELNCQVFLPTWHSRLAFAKRCEAM